MVILECLLDVAYVPLLISTLLLHYDEAVGLPLPGFRFYSLGLPPTQVQRVPPARQSRPPCVSSLGGVSGSTTANKILPPTLSQQRLLTPVPFLTTPCRSRFAPPPPPPGPPAYRLLLTSSPARQPPNAAACTDEPLTQLLAGIACTWLLITNEIPTRWVDGKGTVSALGPPCEARVSRGPTVEVRQYSTACVCNRFRCPFPLMHEAFAPATEAQL